MFAGLSSTHKLRLIVIESALSGMIHMVIILMVRSSLAHSASFVAKSLSVTGALIGGLESFHFLVEEGCNFLDVGDCIFSMMDYLAVL
jgi:hypothetical protein